MRHSRGPGRRHSRAYLYALFGLLLAPLLVGAAGWAASLVIGRTPVELIDYARRRLQGHPKLEAVALPLLMATRQALVGEFEVDLNVPFFVPPLTPNPMRAAPGSPDGLPGLIRVGPQRAVTSIGVAAKLVAPGGTVEIDPGDYLADTAVWTKDNVTVRGLGETVRLIASGADAEGKGIWVVRAGNLTVENITFRGARVDDQNGAGIRLEGGQLTVRNCIFIGNQNGIVTSSEPGVQLLVEDSEFGYNGAGDGQTHGLYVGRIESFVVRGSYFHHANVGHLLKSRAHHNRVEYNRLSDETGGRASYELEFPDGGVAEVVGNIVQQGTGTQNSVIVSFGAEGYHWPRNELAMVHNTIINDLSLGGSFLRVRPGANHVLLRNNLFVGIGKVDTGGTADALGDRDADWRDLVRPGRDDWRIGATARSAWAGTPLAPVESSLRPAFEYVHPRHRHALAAPAALPGALQAGPTDPSSPDN